VVAVGLSVRNDRIEMVEGVDCLVDDERGVDDAVWALLDAAEARVGTLKRAATFCDALKDVMHDPKVRSS
jgi:FixJ family two-component response regulator